MMTITGLALRPAAVVGEKWCGDECTRTCRDG